jgi:hypothetical protein
MSGFLAKVIGWLAKDVIIKGLSNSKLFQAFAVKLDKSGRDYVESCARCEAAVCA